MIDMIGAASALTKLPGTGDTNLASAASMPQMAANAGMGSAIAASSRYRFIGYMIAHLLVMPKRRMG